MKQLTKKIVKTIQKFQTHFQTPDSFSGHGIYFVFLLYFYGSLAFAKEYAKTITFSRIRVYINYSYRGHLLDKSLFQSYRRHLDPLL